MNQEAIDRGHAVAQLDEPLCYKSEGRRVRVTDELD
jgi:hypothetical protein